MVSFPSGFPTKNPLYAVFLLLLPLIELSYRTICYCSQNYYRNIFIVEYKLNRTKPQTKTRAHVHHYNPISKRITKSFNKTSSFTYTSLRLCICPLTNLYYCCKSGLCTNIMWVPEPFNFLGSLRPCALRYKPAGRGFDSRWCH